MAYSRWGSSRWYTYWSEETPIHFKLPTKRLKRRQVFVISDFPSYFLSYGDLEDKGMGLVWDEIREFYWRDRKYISKLPPSAKKPSETEMQELLGYVKQWRQDVDNHFKLLVFLKYEWYFPLRNKIIRLWIKLVKKN